MKTKIRISLILTMVALVVLALTFWIQNHNYVTTPPLENGGTSTSSSNGTRAMSIEDYVKLNISHLSTNAGADEVLGGTFYVTSVEAHGGRGTVKYEDGHNAYTADFTYDTAENGAITVKSFKVRK